MKNMREILVDSPTSDYTDFSDRFTDVTKRDLLLMQSRCHRNASLTALADLIRRYLAEIKEEKRKANPDIRYIAARKQKILEMRQTLKSVQR